MGSVGTRLERWQEPVLVGAAITLFGLGIWGPPVDSVTQPPRDSVVRSAPERLGSPVSGPKTVPLESQRSRADGRGARQLVHASRTEQHEFYRQQWVNETARFYAENPPRQSDTPTQGANPKSRRAEVEAAMGDAVTLPQVPETAIVRATHLQSEPVAGQAAVVGIPSNRPDQAGADGSSAIDPVRRRWHVITWLAAGMLASLAYVTCWPAVPACNRDSGKLASTGADLARPVGVGKPLGGTAESRRPGEAIEIHLPGQWVRLRPTVGQTVRRGVLGGSYVMAACGAWGLIAGGG